MQDGRKHRPVRKVAPTAVFLALWLGSFAALSQDSTAPNSGAPTNAVPATAETNAPATNTAAKNDAPQRDLVAARYLTTCASCHSLTGAKLSGPELTPATQWPEDQLKLGIKKMESKVGPLPDDVVTDLAAFLKAPNVRERLKAESARIAAMFAAKMDPADPVIGQQLFTGARGLKNGGLACAACHSVGGQGGNLGVAMDGVFAKLGGELPLTSAIENANFKIMMAHYKRYPVTKQEAMHLAKYLGTLDPKAAPSKPLPIASAGAGCALAALVGLVTFLRAQRSHRHNNGLSRRRK